MLSNRKHKNVWFMAGLGLGAAAAILLAPQSGRETRKAIASGVNDGLQRATAFGRDTRERMSNMMDSVKVSFARKKQQAGAAINAAKKVLRKAA